jgi:hypothetical protein
VERRLSVPLARARAATRLGVRITAQSDGVFAGAIDVTDEGGTTTRVVEGASCAEVAEALSLIAALGLEPNGVRDRTPASAPLSPLAGGTRDRAGRIAALMRYEALALGLFHGAAGPGGALGAGVAFGLESLRGWRPAFRLGAYWGASARVAFAGGDATARFTLIGAQGVFCLVRFPSAGLWGFRPCVELELGRLSGTSAGPAVLGAGTRSGLWASAGLALRADVDVWGPLRASIAASAIIPFTRHDFTFTPDATRAFRVPAFGWRAAALLGVTF